MTIGRRLAGIVLATAMVAGLSACGGGSTASDGPVVPVSLTEFTFVPSEIKIPADSAVTLEIKNDGTMPHNLAIPGLKVQSDMVSPGEMIKVKVTAKKGSYEAICEVAGHKDSGMVGKVVAE